MFISISLSPLLLFLSFLPLLSSLLKWNPSTHMWIIIIHEIILDICVDSSFFILFLRGFLQKEWQTRQWYYKMKFKREWMCKCMTFRIIFFFVTFTIHFTVILGCCINNSQTVDCNFLSWDFCSSFLSLTASKVILWSNKSQHVWKENFLLLLIIGLRDINCSS